jgi:hypothetical protein
MVAVPFSPVHPLPTTPHADRLADGTPPPNPNREAPIPYLRSFLLAVLTAGRGQPAETRGLYVACSLE